MGLTVSAVNGEYNELPWQDEEERSHNVQCYCGKHRCIEQFVSGTGLCDDYERRSGIRLKGNEITATCRARRSYSPNNLCCVYERRVWQKL